MIMIPILIMQIFLFPLTAGWIMNTWDATERAAGLANLPEAAPR